MTNGESQIATRKMVRYLLFYFLGSSCKRCGFDDERALQIDHVHGGGNQTRNGKNGYNYRYLLNILTDPNLTENYQILCANCNWIKRAENKEFLSGPRRLGSKSMAQLS